MFNGNPTAGLCFINFIGNDPPLHDGVLNSLQRFLNRGRQNQISKRRFDRESNKRDHWILHARREVFDSSSSTCADNGPSSDKVSTMKVNCA
jgi:hypothetical protein